VYGSYSGGIFIMKLDAETGVPLPGQGYGKHLMGGNHARIEGAYILHSPETKYYYLFVTYGGLDSRGGYNMRVARSLRPDGPYVDAAGHAMAEVKADAAKPLFDDRSIEPFGTKLMGNFHFDTVGDGHGYVSPGHNSAYYDAKSGKHFLIFHTRFLGTGERHQVRVHQMFMNGAGWPVVAPYRYAGETLERVPSAEVAGSYRFVNHGRAISADVNRSRPIRLESDGTVTGSHQGRWRVEGKDIEIELDGVIYSGKVHRQWQPESSTRILTLTALSPDGLALWAVRQP
jgi:arabinan endo-1,5-alpha-L-arabinosidase